MRRLAFLLALFALPAWATEPYDTIFRTGTLDGLDGTLTYERRTEIPSNAEVAAQESGELRVALSGPQAEVSFWQGERSRKIGDFPADVGNPLILYFVETVVRGVAQGSGGSPFYIRNRLKDALIAPAEREAVTLRWDGREVAGERITLYPLQDDPNLARMRGYEGLSVSFFVSEAVPGWYHTLEAAAVAGDTPLWSERITLEKAE